MRTDDIDPSDPEAWAKEFLRRFREEPPDPDPHPHTRAEHEAMLSAMRSAITNVRQALLGVARPDGHTDPLIEELRHAEAKIVSTLAEFQRVRERAEDRDLARAQMGAQREAAQASNALAEAANRQTSAMVRWTRVLAFATVALIAATVAAAFIARG